MYHDAKMMAVCLAVHFVNLCSLSLTLASWAQRSPFCKSNMTVKFFELLHAGLLKLCRHANTISLLLLILLQWSARQICHFPQGTGHIFVKHISTLALYCKPLMSAKKKYRQDRNRNFKHF